MAAINDSLQETEGADSLFVRRGNAVIGPMPELVVRRQLTAGKIIPSDFIARSPKGPWELVSTFTKQDQSRKDSVSVSVSFNVILALTGGFGLLIGVVLLFSTYSPFFGFFVTFLGLVAFLVALVSGSACSVRGIGYSMQEDADMVHSIFSAILPSFPVALLTLALTGGVLLAKFQMGISEEQLRALSLPIRPQSGVGGFVFGDRVMVETRPATLTFDEGFDGDSLSSILGYVGTFLGYEDSDVAVVLVDSFVDEPVKGTGRIDGRLHVISPSSARNLSGFRIYVSANSLAIASMARGLDDVDSTWESEREELLRRWADNAARAQEALDKSAFDLEKLEEDIRLRVASAQGRAEVGRAMVWVPTYERRYEEFLKEFREKFGHMSRDELKSAAETVLSHLDSLQPAK